MKKVEEAVSNSEYLEFIVFLISSDNKKIFDKILRYLLDDLKKKPATIIREMKLVGNESQKLYRLKDGLGPVDGYWLKKILNTYYKESLQVLNFIPPSGNIKPVDLRGTLLESHERRLAILEEELRELRKIVKGQSNG